mmetsp:Transcript_15767/g.47677  ORF Transcript_15767/g.47677 Transcript_15767/m.47677 type:complete len:126 (+) Transcript_15767:42-419(+)
MLGVVSVAVLALAAEAFVAPHTPLRAPLTTVRAEPQEGGPFSFLGRLKREVDAVVDDAMMKKLGNGSAFYGKRKSNFYGAGDKEKRTGAGGEDYAGPVGGSYFKLDRDGNPISRRGTPLPRRNDK